MQRLNIPLSKHKKTTRRNRWVVWLWVFFLFFSAVFLLNLGRWWFSRVSVFDAAPADTAVAVQLLINKKTTTSLEKLLSGIPLISNRSLEFSDITSLVHGELGWFFGSDGSRSVAFRGSYEETSEALKGLSVQISQTDTGVLLLSESLPAISGDIEFLRPSFIPHVFPTYLGQISLPGDGIVAKITENDGEVVLKADSDTDRLGAMGLPIGTFFALSTLEWTSEYIPSFVEGVLSQTPLQNFAHFNLFSKETSVILTKDEMRTNFLISTKTSEGVDIPYLLQLLAAAHNPEIYQKVLLDGSVSEELRINPDFVTIEEISHHRSVYLRTKINENEYLFASERDGDLIISNSEALLSFWTFQDEEVDTIPSSGLCNATSFYVDPQILLEEMAFKHTDPTHSFFNALLKRFSAISLETRNGSSRMNLCLN